MPILTRHRVRSRLCSQGSLYGEECVFVANDWHAALLPVYLAAKYRTYGVYKAARSILAIHNLRHQVREGDMHGPAASDKGSVTCLHGSTTCWFVTSRVHELARRPSRCERKQLICVVADNPVAARHTNCP